MTNETSDLTLHILKDIQAKVTRHDEELVGLRREIRDRFDNLIAMFGGSYRDHERRLTQVEVRVDRLDPPTPPRRR